MMNLNNPPGPPEKILWRAFLFPSATGKIFEFGMHSTVSSAVQGGKGGMDGKG
jgi:hypothetical protein